MTNVFIDAAQARRNTRNSVIVHGEIRAIESAILTAIDEGNLHVSVNDTTMTNDSTYYNVWNNITTDITKRDQLTFVRQHFLDLSYDITIVTDPENTAHLQWDISW